MYFKNFPQMNAKQTILHWQNMPRQHDNYLHLSLIGSQIPSPWICLHLKMEMDFPCGSVIKESACDAGDLGSIPGLGRAPGEGKGYPLQYSGLRNSMDYIVQGSQRVGHETEWLSLQKWKWQHTVYNADDFPVKSHDRRKINVRKAKSQLLSRVMFEQEKNCGLITVWPNDIRVI